MTDITTATKLHYAPRDSFYPVLYHNVKIKDSSGKWKIGCVYQNTDEGSIYSRPYDMFDMNKWRIIK